MGGRKGTHTFTHSSFIHQNNNAAMGMETGTKLRDTESLRKVSKSELKNKDPSPPQRLNSGIQMEA